MVNFRIAVALLAASLCVVVPAGAQNTISVASTFLAPGAPLPQSCKDQATMLARELDNFPLLPARWHWIIVCDDASWQSWLRKSGQIGPRQAAIRVLDELFVEIIYASTDLEAGTTVLRGSTLLNPDTPLAHPDHVVAHELAHIVLHTRDENRAEDLALHWLQQREPAYFSWVRDRKRDLARGAPARSVPDQPGREWPQKGAPRDEPVRQEPRRFDPRGNRPTLSQALSQSPAASGQ